LRRSYVDPVNMPAPYGVIDANLLNVGLPAFVCPSTPDGPSDYGDYFAEQGLPLGPLILPRTDYVPIRGLHSSFAVCVGLPNAHSDNAMLSTTDPEEKWKIKFADTTDGLSNTICFVELAGKQKVYFRGRP